MVVGLVAAFWLVGLACLIAALAAGGGPVKIGGVQLPGFGTRATQRGVAAIGVLALALGAVLFLNRNSDTGPAGGGGSPAGGTASGTDGEATVEFHDTITLASGASVNVGALPIQVKRTDFVGSSVYFYGGVLNAGTENALSPFDGAGRAAPADCANDLRTRSVRTLQPRTGLRFCLSGNNGVPRVAYGEITSFDEAAVSLEIDLTVWSATL